MKILIVSDTHGRHRNLEEVLDREGPIDMLVHLGDVEGGEDYICALADCESIECLSHMGTLTMSLWERKN